MILSPSIVSLYTAVLLRSNRSLRRLGVKWVDLDPGGHGPVVTVRTSHAYWTARGGYIESSPIYTDVLELPIDVLGYHLYEDVPTSIRQQLKMAHLGADSLVEEIALRIRLLYETSGEDSPLNIIRGTGKFFIVGKPRSKWDIEENFSTHLITQIFFSGLVPSRKDQLSQVTLHSGVSA